MEAPQVGWWSYICCEEDLAEIHDEADLAACLAWDDDTVEGGMLRHKYFATKADALAAIESSTDLIVHPGGHRIDVEEVVRRCVTLKRMIN